MELVIKVDLKGKFETYTFDEIKDKIERLLFDMRETKSASVEIEWAVGEDREGNSL